MRQHQHLRIAIEAAQCEAEEIGDANVDGHPHAMDGTAQHDAFAMNFDPAHIAVGAHVVRIEGLAARKEGRAASRGSTRRD